MDNIIWTTELTPKMSDRINEILSKKLKGEQLTFVRLDRIEWPGETGLNGYIKRFAGKGIHLYTIERPKSEKHDLGNEPWKCISLVDSRLAAAVADIVGRAL